ncbi:MAG: transporter [Chloroflexi bacterium]|nr:transporter [Chloroflexota bacterium]
MPRDARLLLFSQFFGSLPIGTLLVFFPLYMHDIGTKSILIGGLITGAGIGSSLLLMAIGPLADRFGRREFLIAGTALPTAGLCIFTMTTNTGWLVVASMLGGVGFSGGMGGGLVTATFNPMLAGLVEPRRRTLALSYAEVAWVTALGAGALLAGAPSLVAQAGILTPLAADRALFILCVISSLAATILLLPVGKERHPIKQAPGAPRHGGRRQGKLPRGLIARLAVFFTLQGLGLGMVVQLLPLWFALRFNTSAGAIAPLFSAAQLVGFPLVLLVPYLAKRFGVATLILVVAITSTVLLAGLPIATSLPLAGALFIARSGFVSMQWPAQHSFLQGAVDPKIRATVTSITLGCWSTANAVAPFFAGYLFDRKLLSLPLVLGVSCYGAAALWFLLTLRHIPLPEEQDEATSPGLMEIGVATAG